MPDAVPEFISQRRRWLNGAFFAAVYSLIHFKQIWRTDHTIGRKILLHIEFVYQFVSLAFTYFSLVSIQISLGFWATLMCAGQLLPHLLLHRRIIIRPKVGSFRTQYRTVYIRHTSLCVCAAYLLSIRSVNG